MENVNELSVEGVISTQQTITGSSSLPEQLKGVVNKTYTLSGVTSIGQSSGAITNPNPMSGVTTVPKVLDRTAIHYDTTEAWNSTPNMIAEKGHIYIYKDYDKKLDEDGHITFLPAMKIGDGTSFLIDMPFFSAGNDEDELWDHINNWSIHVSADDRTNWTTKVSATVDERTENLYLVM